MSYKLGKVILLLVEGLSDESALQPLLDSIVREASNSKYRVVPYRISSIVTRCDLTSRYQNDREENIVTLVSEFVKKGINDLSSKKYIKNSNDIAGIIHLIDTDGAYIDEDKIIEDASCNKYIYCDNGIKGQCKESIKERNRFKSRNMNILSGKYIISKLNYRAYFMSCNLDHVLFDKRNLTDKEKEKYSDEFSDKYIEDLNSFKEFINQMNITFRGNRKNTWDNIKKNNNSICRYTNLNLFVNDPLGQLNEIE